MPNGAFAKINVGFQFWKKQIKTTQKYEPISIHDR